MTTITTGNTHTVIKTRKASTSYGRGSDNYRLPAKYDVVNADGQRVAIILGTAAGHRERSTWTVNFLSPGGYPRLIHYSSSFTAAKEWAQEWDGKCGVRAEWLSGACGILKDDVMADAKAFADDFMARFGVPLEVK